ncbi:hypothetical protein LY76DRAFT_383080 [Colletotrichum caudatum]|nr:hypothetical protein LY76DRAFT_383080 [Colletotrichum caudatum]
MTGPEPRQLSNWYLVTGPFLICPVCPCYAHQHRNTPAALACHSRGTAWSLTSLGLLATSNGGEVVMSSLASLPCDTSSRSPVRIHH